jgi:hypothetical protein
MSSTSSTLARGIERCGDQIGVDLLDDGVSAVLGFGLHEHERRVGEHCVVPVGRKKLALAGDLGRVVAADPAHDQSGSDLMPGARERGVDGFGDLRVGDPPRGVFVEDGLRVLDVDPLVVADAHPCSTVLRLGSCLSRSSVGAGWQGVSTVMTSRICSRVRWEHR